MKHIVNLSGGKDSTALLLEMIERGMPIDYIVFANTHKDWDEMLEHIYKVERYIGRPILQLESEESFDYLMFDHIKTKGKNKGKCGYGWATMRARWCTSKLKTDIINRFARSLGDKFIHYVGIAGDEWGRLIENSVFDMESCVDKKGNEKKRPILDKNGCVQNLTYTQSAKRYPLAEWGYSEKQALQYCYNKGFDWGGLYKHFDRLSCWCCPLKNLDELRQLYLYWPDKWDELKAMDKRAYNQYRADYSVEQLEAKFIKEGLRQNA